MTRADNAGRPGPRPPRNTMTPAGQWAGRGHQDRLGKSGWERQRDNDRTMRQHGGICHWCGQPGADRIDHVINLTRGGTDDESNRAPIHSSPCHEQKTQLEARAGRRTKLSRRRPSEEHPGLKGRGGPPAGTEEGPDRKSVV